MWNAFKNVLVRSTRVVARGFVWWFEKLGQNPSLSRDPGIVAWQHFNARRRDEDAELPAGELAKKPDDGGGQGPGRQQMRRPLLGTVRRIRLRRSLGALHQPAFVAVRIANRRSMRGAYRWELGA